MLKQEITVVVVLQQKEAKDQQHEQMKEALKVSHHLHWCLLTLQVVQVRMTVVVVPTMVAVVTAGVVVTADVVVAVGVATAADVVA